MRYVQTLVIVSLACAGVAVAAQEAASYLCTIHRVESADEAAPATKAKRDADYLGKHFTVDRSTGVMRGSLNNAYQRLPTVIDFGTRDSAFKAVTTISFSEGFESGTNIHALTVMEFVPQKKKPFVYLWNADVFYGNCENR